jgi:hypothetical protein
MEMVKQKLGVVQRKVGKVTVKVIQNSKILCFSRKPNNQVKKLDELHFSLGGLQPWIMVATHQLPAQNDPNAQNQKF